MTDQLVETAPAANDDVLREAAEKFRALVIAAEDAEARHGKTMHDKCVEMSDVARSIGIETRGALESALKPKGMFYTELRTGIIMSMFDKRSAEKVLDRNEDGDVTVKGKDAKTGAPFSYAKSTAVKRIAPRVDKMRKAILEHAYPQDDKRGKNDRRDPAVVYADTIERMRKRLNAVLTADDPDPDTVANYGGPDHIKAGIAALESALRELPKDIRKKAGIK